MTEILTILFWVMMSALKFFMAAPSISLLGYSYWETILITITGGSIGVLFFYYGGGLVFAKISALYGPSKKEKEPKKKFTRRNKWIIKVKSNFGLIGLSLLTPSLLSIPLGAILAAKYFRYDPKTVPYMLLSVVFWSFAITTFVVYIKPFFA